MAVEHGDWSQHDVDGSADGLIAYSVLGANPETATRAE